jgi:acetolactate synthase-1/2/3 large subunit
MRIAASGRPGPVHVGLPFDVLEELVAKSRGQQPGPDDFHPIVSLLDVTTADAVLGHLASAKRPLLLAGPALCAAGRRVLLDQFAATTFVPALGLESPRGVNDPSLGGFAKVLSEADVVLLVGKRLDYTLNFGQSPVFDPRCRFLHVDPDAHVLDQTRRAVEDSERLALADIADPLPALERLLSRAREREWRRNDWFERVIERIADRPREWATLRSPAAGPLHPAEVCRVVDEFLSQEEASVFVSDGGEFGQWAQANIDGTHRLINGPSGGIGSGLSFALAARLVHPEPEWRIAATLGDGTLGFHLAEFDTAVRRELPVVVVVGNDARWNAEWQLQQRNYGADRVHGCDLLPTRYDEAVRALGGHGEFVVRPDELAPALERAFDSRRPACVNVLIQPAAAPVVHG